MIAISTPRTELEMYRDRVAENPGDANLRVLYANVLRFLGRRDAAREQYQAATQADPTNVEAFVNLASWPVMPVTAPKHAACTSTSWT